MLRENGICFPEGFHHDDTYVSTQLVRFAQTIDRYNYEAHAFRRNNPLSLTTSLNTAAKNTRDMLHIFNALKFDEHSDEPAVYDFLSSSYVYWMGKVANLLARTSKANIPRTLDADIAEMSKYRFVRECPNLCL